MKKAAAFAVENDAVLLAESTCRFVRHPSYHPNVPERCDYQPTSVHLRNLPRICGRATLVTYVDPDATNREIRSRQSKRGQEAKNKKGGRLKKKEAGYKKDFRLGCLPKVRWMKWVGMSNRAVANSLGTDERNIRRWGAAFLSYRDCGKKVSHRKKIGKSDMV